MYLLLIRSYVIKYSLFTSLFLLFLSCTNTPPNKFSDETFVRISDFQDRRLSDSLLTFLKSENPEYRKSAALAFASIQDTTAVEVLGKLFSSDRDANVRKAAAFALGQTGGNNAIKILLSAPTDGVLDMEVSEALGKIIQKKSEFQTNFTSWGLYRLAMRGLADSVQLTRAIEYLNPANDESVRLGAANFFSRGPAAISIAQESLLRTAQNDSSVYVRMAAATSLRKISNPEVLQSLMRMFGSEKDYRVRVSILRALQPYPFSESSEVLLRALDDENVNTAIAATEVIKQVASAENYSLLVEKARASSNWRVKSNLYEAALAASGHKELSEEIVKLSNTTPNNYLKAGLISALGFSPMQFGFVRDQLLTSSIPVIRSTAATSLVRMNRHKLFEKSMQTVFLDCYKKALQVGDAAVIGIISSALADSVLGYKRIIDDFQFLYDTKQNLTLPKDNEALQPLEAAIAYFEGKKVAPSVTNEFNHPIDWKFVKSIPKNQRVVIHTEKGKIEIQLFVEEAPGSVANFLKLAQANYFDSKNFHRVVPNFVIQGGCNRGDGWGSEDYSIRSEFSMRRYTEGSVGMASAGKDTEGTQWFITHSPTSHLDGRYTIFAEVVRGMEVVHRMEVGDQILSVEIVKK